MTVRFFRDLSIAHKIAVVITLTSSLVLLVVCSAFVVNQVVAFRRAEVDQLSALAGVVGSNTAAALVFNDPKAAEETLAALQAHPHIVAGEVYTADGALFAAYRRPSSGSPGGAPAGGAAPSADAPGGLPLGHRFSPAHLDLVRSVELDGEVLGTVHLRSSLAQLHAALRWYAGIALGVFALSIVAAYLLSLRLQRLISAPIQQLARTMRIVSEVRNYALREEKTSNDEIGSLIDGFNQMLAQIQARDEELAKLATAVEQAAEAIVITDTAGRIEYVNPAFERTTGYARAEALGRRTNLVKSGVHDPSFYRELWQTIGSGRVWTGRFTNRRKDGALYEEECTISPVRDEQGRIVHYVAVKRDVTTELRLEQQLNQAQKLKALGTLAGGIAHDFNNILVPILGYAEMAQDELAADGPVRLMLDQVIAGAERARDLVRQILSFSRPADPEQKIVRLTPIVSEVLQLMRATLPATIEIRQEFRAGRDVVRASPTQLHQILVNLCTNAWHAMEDDRGVLTVQLEELDGDDGVARRHPQLAPGPWVRLTVADTGCGMPPEVLDRIFEPFFTTREVGEGTGLGLAAAHGIVDSIGGCIEVESTPGAGTSFAIYLPLTSEEEEEERLGPRAGRPTGTERLLLVDDEETIVELGQQALENLGYSVDTATSGAEALERFAADPDGYDLVITDQTMPGMTGMALAQELLRIRADLPIILCTGYSPAATPEKVRAIGIRELVGKPTTVTELSEAVRRALDGV
ncbi:MAG: hypothetical protein Kow0092_14150 [Deferrisomatales bacterium]